MGIEIRQLQADKLQLNSQLQDSNTVITQLNGQLCDSSIVISAWQDSTAYYKAIANGDTCHVTINDTIFTTIFDTTFVTINDTIFTNIYDTTFITVNDTVFTNIFDTTFVTINDTVLIEITDTIDIVINGFEIETSVQELMDNIGLSVYPNPATDILNIEHGTVIEKVEIISITGAVLYMVQPNFSSVQISVSDVVTNQSIVFVKVYDAQGRIITLKVTIVQ